MVERPNISRGETEVLKALWEIDKGSVGEIHAAVAPEKGMDYTTVQTYLRRLESKGYISTQRIGRNKIYRPSVERNQVVGEALDEFLDRLFDGELLPMVKQLVDSRSMSESEIADLTELVQRLQKEQDNDKR